MKTTKWYVYHIARLEDRGNLQLGYVGVTSNPKKRFIDHSKNKSIVGSAIRKYNLNFENLEIVGEFSESVDAYNLEEILRPIERIGWNDMKGGNGYTDGHRQNPWLRGKISTKRKALNIKSPQSKEHYQMLAETQKGSKREIIKCEFCETSGGYGNMQRWHFANCKLAPKFSSVINSFDCDGVITIGLFPGPSDVIITGRSFEESEETLKYFKNKGIKNQVFLSPHKFEDKTRIKSGIHKGNTIWQLFKQGILVQNHFDDDFDQIKEIRKIIKYYGLKTNVIWVNHNGLEELENVKRDEHGMAVR